MEGQCRLCNKNAELQLSHVLPAFAFRWQKKSGGHIRHSTSINQRVQDGAKEYWRCRTCETQFSSWETKFSSAIFHPTNSDGLPSIRYGEWLLRFCTSVSWRSLLYLKQQTGFKNFSAEQIGFLGEALDTWLRFLRGELPHPGMFEQHLVPFGPMTGALRTKWPPNINRYLLRTIEINFGSSASAMFVYSKLGRFAVLGFVKLDFPKQWIGSRVRLRGGVLKPREYIFPVQFGDFLAYRARKVQDIMAEMSETQQRKVDDAIRADLDWFADTDLFRAIQLDVEMFGKSALRK